MARIYEISLVQKVNYLSLIKIQRVIYYRKVYGHFFYFKWVIFKWILKRIPYSVIFAYQIVIGHKILKFFVS